MELSDCTAVLLKHIDVYHLDDTRSIDIIDKVDIMNMKEMIELIDMTLVEDVIVTIDIVVRMIDDENDKYASKKVEVAQDRKAKEPSDMVNDNEERGSARNGNVESMENGDDLGGIDGDFDDIEPGMMAKIAEMESHHREQHR